LEFSEWAETRTAMGMLCVDTIEAVLQGGDGPALVGVKKTMK
jgi:hypothetical protein